MFLFSIRGKTSIPEYFKKTLYLCGLRGGARTKDSRGRRVPFQYIFSQRGGIYLCEQEKKGKNRPALCFKKTSLMLSKQLRKDILDRRGKSHRLTKRHRRLKEKGLSSPHIRENWWRGRKIGDTQSLAGAKQVSASPSKKRKCHAGEEGNVLLPHWRKKPCREKKTRQRSC